MGVAVPGGRLLGLPESPVVERNNAKPCLHDRLENAAPRVDRCAEAVQEHDGRARSGVDVADPGPRDGEETRAERRAGGVASALGKGRGPARQGKGPKGERHAAHRAPPSAPPATATNAGGEVQNGVSPSAEPTAANGLGSSI